LFIYYDYKLVDLNNVVSGFIVLLLLLLFYLLYFYLDTFLFNYFEVFSYCIILYS